MASDKIPDSKTRLSLLRLSAMRATLRKQRYRIPKAVLSHTRAIEFFHQVFALDTYENILIS